MCPTKKTKTTKKATAGKSANAARMKKITTLAKSIRSKSPTMKWTNAIKQASKQLHK